MQGGWFIAALCVLLNLSNCFGASVRSGKGSSPLGARLNQVECLNGVQTNSTDGANRQARRSSGPDDQALNALFAGQMQFSIDMFKAVYNSSSRSLPAKGAGDNIFFSPMSVYSALLLAYFGSHNRTEDQLSQALGFKDMDKVGAVQAYKLVKFTRQLMRVAGLVKYDFDIANRMYFDEQEDIRPCMKDIFSEDIEMVNFAFKPEEARKSINQWVEDVTRNKIQDFATPDMINGQTRMALVNAAYFKGLWASQFKAANTRVNNFFINSKESGFANLMFQKGRYRHAVSEELQANLLEMPFLGEDVSFFVLLPEGNGGLDETISRLSLASLQEAMSRTFPLSLEIGIPKFRMEQSINLQRALVKLGLNDLFDASSADLSGFTGVRGLSLASATHKAFIEVNEEGSEAAAATALVDLRMARPLAGTKFICDHPFLFFIYDNLSESILFMGVYRNPK